jgi:branched-chain amino acid transport system substrate-binding protein
MDKEREATLRRSVLILLGLILVVGLLAGACGSGATTTTAQPAVSSTAVGAPTTAGGPATTAAAGGADKVLKIGVMAPLTGMSSAAGIPHQRMTEICAEWINQNGGVKVNGESYKIELIIEDEGETPDSGVTAATKLVETDKVKFIVGTISPQIASAAAAVTEPAKVLRSLWHGEGTQTELNAQMPYTFRVPICPHDFAMEMLKYNVEAYPQAKKITLLFIDNSAGVTLADQVKVMIGDLGLQHVETVMYPVNTKDFSPIISNVMRGKPDAIVCTALPPLMGGILKTAREKGFEGPIYNLSPTSPATVQMIASPQLATDCIVPAPDLTSTNIPPLMKEMVDKVAAKYNEVSWDYLRPFDALWVLVQAIEAAQSLDTTEVAKAWENMKSFKTLEGDGVMGGLQTYGVNHQAVMPFAITKISGDKMELVKWVTPSIP